MLPVICCHWLSPAIVNLVTVPSAVRLKHLRAGPKPSWIGDYCFPSGCYCWEGSGLSEQDDCCIWGLAQHGIPVATFSLLSPKPQPGVSLQVSLVHSAPPWPVIYFLWLPPSLVRLVSSLRLKHQRDRAENLLGLGLLFPLRLLPLSGEWSA